MLDVERFARFYNSRRLAQLLLGRHRLQQTLNRSDDHRRRLAILERLEQAQTRAEDFIVQHPFARVAFPSWQLSHAVAGEQRKICAERIDVFTMRQHDDQGLGAAAFQGCRDQRAGRSPDTAEGGAVASGKAGQHRGEVALLFDLSYQIVQLSGC